MLTLKTKQQQVVEAVNNPAIHTIVLIGTLGTGKTDVASHIGICIAYEFPKTYWTVFRQNISTAKRSVIPSYLEMLDKMNFTEKEDYKYNKNEFEITFLHNKSKIGFIEADVTKDRQGKKIKGINATGNHIDEGDELDRVMFMQAMARRGRRNEHKQPSLSIITMNPNDTYLRELFYKPYKSGTLPKDTVVIEFTEDDSWQTKEDLDAMKTNPRGWVARYIENNWDYQDDDNSLFKYRDFDAALVSMLDINAVRTAGYDVAREGTDRSVWALWYGRTLVDIIIVKDKTQKMKTDEQAMEVIKLMTTNSVIAENIAVDAVGVGVGIVDHMHSKGINVREFKSGAMATVDTFDKLRSQVIFEFAQGLEKGTIKIYEGCPFRNELISEAMAHLHKTGDKKMAVESKDEVKKRTGSLSPDIFDAVVMGLYPQLQLDPEQDQGRISW